MARDQQNPESRMRSTYRHVPIPNSELLHVLGARAAGRLNLGETAEVTVFLRGASSSQDVESDAHNLGSLRVSARRYLSRSEAAQAYGAEPADISAVESFANEYGLTVSAISPAQRTIRLAGSLANLGKAFNVQFGLYQSPQGLYRGYTGSVHVPDHLSSTVRGVFGLDTKPQSTFHLRTAPTGPYQARAGMPAAKLQTYFPNEVASLYQFPTDADGSGQCIAIIEFGGGYTQSDLDAYFQQLGIATPNIVSVSVGNATNHPVPGQNSPDYEVLLDIEVVGAIVPGAQIVVYFAPNTTLGWLRAVNTAIHDSYHNPSVVSISWGGPENTWTRAAIEALNFEFAVAAMMGITVCAAAGDQGFTDGVPGTQAHVDFPASSPYVVACGGTRLQSSNGSISAETVWNDSPSSATGGGVSSVFSVPPYQQNANIPQSQNPPPCSGRGVPDVAGDADPKTGYRTRVHGQDTVIGGTSAVAPLWASLFTLINQKLGNSLGFVNPLLYGQGVDGGGFNDIVTGNNGQGGYAAGPGWDACTGLGTPIGTTLADVL
jgi:kumamolisin